MHWPKFNIRQPEPETAKILARRGNSAAATFLAALWILSPIIMVLAVIAISRM